MNRWILLSLLIGGVAMGEARAEVTFSAPGVFEVKSVTTIAAAPAKVYATLTGQVGEWWNPEHSWSGRPGALYIEPRAGGCFCENLADGGSVQHLEVVHAKPAALLRMRGGLGPLQELPLEGVQTWELKAAGSGQTEVSLSYRASGSVQGGLERWAGPVDFVHAEQLGRLKQFVETGTPD